MRNATFALLLLTGLAACGTQFPEAEEPVGILANVNPAGFVPPNGAPAAEPIKRTYRRPVRRVVRHPVLAAATVVSASTAKGTP